MTLASSDSSVHFSALIISPGPDQNLIEQFINGQDVKDSSKITYRRNIRLFLLHLKRHNITQPTEEDILRYKNHLIDRELSVLTINNHLTTIKLFFRYLKYKKLYEDIAQRIKMLSRSKDFYRDALSVEQINDLFGVIDQTTVKGKRDFAIINLLVRTGLRLIEVQRINNEDIRKSGNATILKVMGKGRNEKNDTVVLTHSSIKPILIYQATKKMLNDQDPLFTSLSPRYMGQRLSTRSLSRMIHEYFVKAGIVSPRITPHSLRHSAVTLALEGGATLQETQAMARHHNINTTMVYAHNIDRIANAAEYKIDKVLSPKEAASVNA